MASWEIPQKQRFTGEHPLIINTLISVKITMFSK